MKKQKKYLSILLVLLMTLSLLSGCDNGVNNGKNPTQQESQSQMQSGKDSEKETDKENDSEKSSESDKPSDTEKAEDSEKPSDSQKPTDSETPSNGEKPSGSEKPADSQNPSDTEKPENSEKPGNSEKPVDSQKPSDSEKPDNGSGSDGGSTSDSGSKPDNGGTSDTGSTPDSGSTPDTGNKPNTGTTPSTPTPPTPTEPAGETARERWAKVPSFNNSQTEDYMAQTIVNFIITGDMSELEKVISIHDWLTFNVDYDSAGLAMGEAEANHTAKEAFVERRAVCDGYAHAFELLCSKAGIETAFVTGYAGEAHAWNQVKIDGTWYNVDVTWDDPLPQGGNKDFNDHSGNGYNYFLISDAQMYADHTPDSNTNMGAVPPAHSCGSSYDRIAILDYALNCGAHTDTAFAKNIAEADAAMTKFMNAEKTSFSLWYYDTSMPQEGYLQYMLNNLKASSYIVSSIRGSAPVNGVARFEIPITPMSQWNTIPLVHNVAELEALANAKVASGIYEFTFRYETTAMNFEIPFPAGTSGYNISYNDYKDGYSRLITIGYTPQ